MTSELRNPALEPPIAERRAEFRSTGEKQFICPGEKLPISRSIHLARLAAFYPACRECPHRNDTGHLPAKTIEHLEETQKRIGRTNLFTAEGIRGVYLNEIDRKRTERIVSTFAALVLENYPRQYRSSSENKTCESPRPRILVGHDSRASSFELMATTIGSLLRMGIVVTEIGLSSRSSFCFAVKHLQATAGILITGSGCDPAWTGFDFVGESAIPFSLGGSLEKLRLRLQTNVSRASRLGASLNSFQAATPYRTNLWKHFQHLEPLDIVCVTSDPFTKQTLLEMFAKLPCRMTFIDMPLRKSQTSNRQAAETTSLADCVVRSDANLGLTIEQDSMTCHFLDERGQTVSASSIVRLLISNPTHSKVGSAIVLTDLIRNEIQKQRSQTDLEIFPSEDSMEAVSKTMRMNRARFGAEEEGRFWFWETSPVCDSIPTLGVVLQILSRTEKPISELIAEIQAQ